MIDQIKADKVITYPQAPPEALLAAHPGPPAEADAGAGDRHSGRGSGVAVAAKRAEPDGDEAAVPADDAGLVSGRSTEEQREMAHKKAGGSSRNGRDSAGRRLGVKKFGGEAVIPGNIIVRQRGTKWWPGDGVGMGTDHTIFATAEGHVTFQHGLKGRTFISVLPSAEAAE